MTEKKRTLSANMTRYALSDLINLPRATQLLSRFSSLHQMKILLVKGDVRDNKPTVLASFIPNTKSIRNRDNTALLADVAQLDWSDESKPWYSTRDQRAIKLFPLTIDGEVHATLLVGFIAITADANSSSAIPESRFRQSLQFFRSIINLFTDEATLKLQAEESKRALTRSDRRYRAYFDDCPDAILVTDDRGGIMEVNPSAIQLTGYSTYDLLGFSLYELADEYHRDRIVALLEKIRVSLKASSEFKMVCADKRRVYVELDAAVLSEHEYLVFLKDISDRKQIEKEVQDQMEYFHRVFQNNPSPMLLINMENWCVTAFNQRFLEVTGLSHNQIIGLCLKNSDLFISSEWDPYRKRIERIGYIKEASLRIRGRNKTMRETLLSAEVFELLEKSHCVATFFDVTDRNQAERMLAISEQRLRSVTDNINGMVAQYLYSPGAQTKFCFSSKGSYALFGLEPEQIIKNSKLLTDRIHPDDLRQIISLHRNAHQTESAWDAEFRVQIPMENTVKWVHCNATPLRNKNSEISWTCFLLDVTDKKNTTEQLRRSKQKTTFYLQHTPLAYVELDSRLAVAEWNNAAQILFGYSREEAVGKVLTELIVPDDMLLQANTILDQLMVHEGGELEEMVNVTRADERLICEWHSTSLTKEQGGLAGIAILIRNITEQKLLEGALREHREHLEQLIEEQVLEIKTSKQAAELSDQAKTDFLCAMSTTLRDPLHSIMAFSELYLANPANLTDTQKNDYVGLMRKSAERLLPVLKDLTYLTRLDLGELQFNFVSHHLGELVLSTIEAFKQSSHDYQDVVFKVDYQTESLTTKCDAERIRHVLMNVFQNAVKFSPAPANITIRLYQDELTRLSINGSTTEVAIAVEIRDHGIGIPASDVATVFDPSATDNRNKHGFSGAGLGLPLCREFIEQHRGKIEAANSPEGGVAITFLLPYEH